MSTQKTSNARMLRVVRRSEAYGACERCGESETEGLNRCDGCGTVYEHRAEGP